MTQQKPLRGKKVAVLVTDAFEQIELTSPRQALIDAGAEVKIISNKSGEVQAFKGKEKGDTFKVDYTFDQTSPDDYDALMLPGGAYNSDKIRMVKRPSSGCSPSTGPTSRWRSSATRRGC